MAGRPGAVAEPTESGAWTQGGLAEWVVGSA